MLNRDEIHRRIKHIFEHGDCAQDVRNLAALMYVEEHMTEDGHHESGEMDEEKFAEWVNSMHGNDPAVPHGAKWNMEQVRPVAQKYGVPTEGRRFWEFWAVMNALYNDYYSVAKKYNTLTPDFFADMAMAFINDSDAMQGKVERYYRYIAKK